MLLLIDKVTHKPIKLEKDSLCSSSSKDKKKKKSIFNQHPKNHI